MKDKTPSPQGLGDPGHDGATDARRGTAAPVGAPRDNPAHWRERGGEMTNQELLARVETMTDAEFEAEARAREKEYVETRNRLETAVAEATWRLGGTLAPEDYGYRASDRWLPGARLALALADEAAEELAS